MRVNPLAFGRPAGLLLLALLAPAPALVAQNALFVKQGDHSLLVRGAEGLRPCVEVEGKITPVSGNLFTLRPVAEYLPIFVSVRDVHVTNAYIEVSDTAQQINQELQFKARFEAPYRLDHVFLLLDMDTEVGGKVFFLWGLGDLVPHEPKSVALSVPLAYALGAGHFQFHLFVGGAEVLHSEMPFDYREGVLNRMIAKRIASVANAAPKPFVGPLPEYPPKFWKKKIPGKVMISVRITPNGVTLDPTVTSASDPAFGETALAAVRLWRFLPKVEAGRPVESLVSIPFVFDPPAAKRKKS